MVALDKEEELRTGVDIDAKQCRLTLFCFSAEILLVAHGRPRKHRAASLVIVVFRDNEFRVHFFPVLLRPRNDQLPMSLAVCFNHGKTGHNEVLEIVADKDLRCYKLHQDSI